MSVVLELRNGLRYFVRSGTTDLAVVNEAMFLNPYLGPGYLKLQEDAVVVDVGANIGDFTIQVAGLCPRGRVYAVEPISANAQMIAINKIINASSNVTIVHLALGSHEGEIEIHDDGANSTFHLGNNAERTETVRLTSLAELMREQKIERIDLLKLDCEGAEWDILPASSDVLSQVSQICMEFHPEGEWTAEKLVFWLREHGYDVRYTREPWSGYLWATRSRFAGSPS